MGINIAIHRNMRENAREKKDGIYSIKNNYYLVYKNQLAAYCDYFGNIYECSYGFNIYKGKEDSRVEARKVLQSYLKQLKG